MKLWSYSLILTLHVHLQLQEFTIFLKENSQQLNLANSNMAYSSLVSLQQTIDLVLNHHKYSISVDEREIVTSICEYVAFLISLLENLPQKANRMEGKIRDLANEAEDVIEHFMWNQFHMDWSVGLSRVEFQGRLNRVREEIGSIAGDMRDDRLCDIPAAISSKRVASTGENDVVMGLDEDLLAIKGRLCGESSKLEVIPIVGMGGIGKTTLARYAYNDPLIMEYFYIRAFVQVSQDYRSKDFLSNLLASIKLFEEQVLGENKFAENEYNESEIAEKVYKSLKGMKYLIVMDDIWCNEVWDDVRNIFPDDKNGSRIMLTTRLSDVAAYASSGSPLQQMKFMNRNQSWDLLKQKVFTNSQDCPPELEDIGKAIAGGCRGLPLAVVLVAGILSTMVMSEASWEKIAKNVNSVVNEPLDKILSLSYSHLPHHLRSCFLFMAGLPEDYKIRASRLIMLWVAEGFLKHENGYKSLEDEAEEYLEDLVKRSLVLVTSRKINGKIKSCSLHDLVRDMCVRKAQEEKFLLTSKDILPNGRIDHRHISTGLSRLDEIQSPAVRTIICFPTSTDCSPLPSFLLRCRLLRVWEVINDKHDNVVLPPQVFELFHLRYLALALTNELPAPISKLVNLQTLIVSRGQIQPEIWWLPHLRHLVFINFYSTLPYPADGSALPLENLQTLSGIESFERSERILKMIPNLKRLGIRYNVTEENPSLLHNLSRLHQLEKLKITFEFCYPLEEEYLAFPKTLKELSLVEVRLPWKDMSIVGSLPNLQVLKLRKYFSQGTIWETRDGEFPQLKYLLIEYSNLQHWITESGHFPRLKRLVLKHCFELTEIPDGIGEIPTLEMIEVENAPKVSMVNSIKQMQEDLKSYGNDALQIHFISSDQEVQKLVYDAYRLTCRQRELGKELVDTVTRYAETALLQLEFDEE
ncbi:hypothetical protein ACS0TY_004825 [Phlomoides rotata]